MRRSSGIEFVKAEKLDIDIIGINNEGVNTIFFIRRHMSAFVDYSYYLMVFMLRLLVCS